MVESTEAADSRRSGPRRSSLPPDSPVTSCGLLCTYSTAAETAASYTHTHHQLRVTLYVLHCAGDGRQLHSHTPPAAGYSARTPLRRRRPPVTLTHTTSCGLLCTYSTAAETAASYTHTHHQLRVTLHVLHCGGDGRQLHSHTPPAAGYSVRTPLRRRRPPVTLTHTTSCGLSWPSTRCARKWRLIA